MVPFWDARRLLVRRTSAENKPPGIRRDAAKRCPEGRATKSRGTPGYGPKLPTWRWVAVAGSGLPGAASAECRESLTT